MNASVALILMAAVLGAVLLFVASCAPQAVTPSEEAAYTPSLWLGGPMDACQVSVGADGQVGC